ncbi:MAG: hypothetical protein K2N06_10985 [Oscillospiraceae bacterium]|nr:hypothetical protein [Oscillospiraceae bacterium]
MDLNKLSSALIKLRFALLNSDSAGAIEHLIKVRAADSELPVELHELRLLIDSAANRIEELLNLGEIEHACALSDAIHALPEIAISSNADICGFQKSFVKPFAQKWNDRFFDEFDLTEIFKR